jgi:hypothetical protein
MSAAGFHIAGGNIYMATVQRSLTTVSKSDSLVLSASRFVRSPGSTIAMELHDLESRVGQELRASGVASAAIAETRLFSNWKYSEAFLRSSLVTVVLLACAEQGVHVEIVKTEAISRLVRQPSDKLNETAPATFNLSTPPMYWKAGVAVAHGAAAVSLDLAGA